MIKQYQPNIPMLRSGLVAKHLARFAVTVDFPTPPLPDNTRTCRKQVKPGEESKTEENIPPEMQALLISPS